ncbi:MAG: thermonuclease family protein [bacterium]
MFFNSKAIKAPLVGAFLFAVVLNSFPSVFADDARTVEVKFVIDGDTVVLENGEKVRLIGINAPEKEFDQRPAQPYALEALLALREMVQGRSARLISGRQQKDTYGRTLGYLESTDGVDLQQGLVSKGYAFVVAFPPDIDRLQRYLGAEATARAEQLGIWKDDTNPVADLDRNITLEDGFGLYRGNVLSIGRSRKNVRLEFSSGLIATIRHTDWKEYWSVAPESYQGETVELRGWLRKASDKNKGRYYLRVRHPAMMQLVE